MADVMMPDIATCEAAAKRIQESVPAALAFCMDSVALMEPDEAAPID